MPSKTKLKKLLKRLGTQVFIASKLGTKQSTIATWIQNGQIPAERAKQIYQLFDGKVKLSQMRPDLWED
jgi:DNA-binding transcriptional regulator YdaS (Cro superfamily)